MSNLLLVVVVLSLLAQTAPAQPPVIDMHLHSTNTSPRDLARLDALNVRYLFVSSLQPDLAEWSATVNPARYLPALVLPCDGGRAPVTGRQCFEELTSLPNSVWLRGELKSGRIRGLGELSPQYLGMAPDDARLEPYWQLAEEFDVPVGIHMGPGPQERRTNPVRCLSSLRRSGWPTEIRCF